MKVKITESQYQKLEFYLKNRDKVKKIAEERKSIKKNTELLREVDFKKLYGGAFLTGKVLFESKSIELNKGNIDIKTPEQLDEILTIINEERNSTLNIPIGYAPSLRSEFKNIISDKLIKEAEIKIKNVITNTIQDGNNKYGMTFRDTSGEKTKIFESITKIPVNKINFEKDVVKNFLLNTINLNENLKLVINDNQFTILGEGFFDNLGKSARNLAAGVAIGASVLGGQNLKAQDIKPSGRWVYQTGEKADTTVIDNYNVTINSPYAIAMVLDMVFNQPQNKEKQIPVKIGQDFYTKDDTVVFDSATVRKMNKIFSDMIVDTSREHGTFYAPKGFEGEKDFDNASIGKLFKALFSKNVKIPLQSVKMRNEDVKEFLQMVAKGETPFNFKRLPGGQVVFVKEY